MIRFRLIVNCGPCEKFIGKCLQSIRKQSFENWDAWVTVDPCGDRTFECAVLAADGDPRIHLIQNETHQYSLHNLVDAIERSRAGQEDVIAVLDGDDWFATKHALKQIAQAYERFDCWMTYGSWRSNVAGPNGRRDGLWPAYPEGTSDFRHVRWLGTAVRTWKKWLWDHLDDADLRNEAGGYFRIAEDQAIMLPLLEMSGTAKARHIATPIMVYNKKVRYSIPDAIAEERESNGLLLGRRPPYRRLEKKLYREAVAAAGAH